MTTADLIIKNIKTLYTPKSLPPVKGRDMDSVYTIHNCYVAIKNGHILNIGTMHMDNYIGKDTIIHDAKQSICVPGFIDSHTHLVHAGSREDEFERLKKGEAYLDILKDGGGILNTVEKTRQADFQHLYEKAYSTLNEMMKFGVTTVEAKSGYGLDLENETKQLKVAQILNHTHPVEVISTYMGAHAVPKEFKNNKKGYIDQVIKDLKEIHKADLAQSVDVFCETHVFDIEETKRILESAIKLGFKVKLHADEINPLGGAGLGVSLGATSVDHLMAISDEDILKLVQSNTIANILPGTSFYLGKAYARARHMIDQGVALSIAGDYNPGSCPSENFQFIMHLAANKLFMTANEILTATTINPAYHLGVWDKKGSIEIGKEADLVLLNAPNLNYVMYHFGINHVKDVFIKGTLVVNNQWIERI